MLQDQVADPQMIRPRSDGVSLLHGPSSNAARAARTVPLGIPVRGVPTIVHQAGSSDPAGT